jgi:hypothetical protein
MGAIVDAQVMEATWKAVGAMSEAQIRHTQALCAKQQQELTGFAMVFTSDLPAEAIGLALYVSLVVMEAFRRSGARFGKLKPAKIERAWNASVGFVGDLRAAGHSQAPFQLNPDLVSEPAVMQYVIDALTEQDPDDPVALSDEAFWRILQVLKTVADCMHLAGQGK